MLSFPKSPAGGLGSLSALAYLLERGSHGVRLASRAAGNASAVMSFLSGSLYFKPRADDIFIASYPRSGTTWVQFILYQLTTDGKMDFDHLSQVSPWYERSMAIDSSAVRGFEGLGSRRLFKTHLLPGWLPTGARCIYVVRDGMDVLCSYFHFYRSHLAFKGSFADFFTRFMDGRLQYRSWFDHVAAWRAREQRGETLIIAYEDLKRSIADTVRRIARFCEIEFAERRLDAVLERCTFDFMKQYEQKFDHITGVLMEKRYKNNSFIRKGSVGEGDALLDEQQKRVFAQMSQRHVSSVLPEWHLADFLH
jgi:hypothetical protein